MVIHPWPLLEISLSDFRGLVTLNINTYLPTYFLVAIIMSLLPLPFFEGVVVLWCDPLTLQPAESRRVGSNPGRALSLEIHDKGSQTRLGLLYFCDPSTWH